MFFKLFSFLLILQIVNLVSSHDSLTVTTSLGKIQGSILKSRFGKDIYSFRSVRYAKPPVNELRFKNPVPVDPWTGVLNATEDGPLCPQPGNVTISEDCLFLNVYTTKLPNSHRGNPKRPVIVYFHPGAFYISGSPSWIWSPSYFMDEDIVLVSVSFRLASLGFLSTGDKEATGNYGFKDQVLALKWVQKHIERFGGDPNSVTIMGYSAGGMSTALHIISPMSKGLFHRVIDMSASPYGTAPIYTNQLDLAKQQARLLGCPDDTSANIVNCLRTKPYQEFANAVAQIYHFPYSPVLIWNVVIETDCSEPRFLTDHPIKIIESGNFTQVPFLTGITRDEFGYFAVGFLNNQTVVDDYNKNFDKYAPDTFQYEGNSPKSLNITHALKKFYLNDQPLSKSSLSGLAKWYADSITGFQINRGVKLMAKNSRKPVYYYEFAYEGRYSYYYMPGTNDTKFGVVHHDDLIYLLYNSAVFPPFNPEDRENKMIDKMITLWTNFAKTGNPTPDQKCEVLQNVNWEPFNTKTKKYMHLDEKLEMREGLYERRYQEWEKLFPIQEYLDTTYVNC